MVATPHCGARFLFVEKAACEISSTGGRGRLSLSNSAHEKAIGDAKLVNRLAAREGLPPIFTGDETQRHQIADFCLELDQYLFQNRRMKLS